MTGRAGQSEEMRRLIQETCQACGEPSPQRLLALFTRKSVPCLFGISGDCLDRGASEIAERHAQDAASPTQVQLSLQEAETQEAGQTGFAIGLLNARAEFDGGAYDFQVRFSGAAEREDGALRWRHLHLSVSPSVAVELGA